MDARLTADHRQLARALAGLVVQAATNRDETGTPIIPPSRKALDDLKAAVWERVRAYYIGSGTDALDGPNPRSPYALLLVEGIAQATRIQAERQAALVRRLVKDPEVVRWLTGPRPMLPTREMAPTFAGRITELTLTPTRDTLGGLRGADGRIDTDRARAALVRPRGTYEPFHSWVDPNGYRLSDRIWRTSIDVRSRIDLLLDYEVARGTSAVDIANLLEPFMTPGARGQRTIKPYGREGSFSARRLARTEITAASGRATVNAAAANPFVAQLQWRLSPSHPKIDRCDDHARGGPNGDGIYDIDKLPRYPDHPNCLCSILPVPTGSTADLVQTLRADIQAARGNLIDAASGGDPARARALQGTLSPEYLTQAMMSGNLDDAVAQAVRQAQTVRPVVPKVATPVVAPSAPAGRDLAAVRQNLASQIDAPMQEIDRIDAGVASAKAQYKEASERYQKGANLSNEEILQLGKLVNSELPARLKEYEAQRQIVSAQMRQAVLRELELPKDQRANIVLHLDNIKTKKTKEAYRLITEEASDFVNRLTARDRFSDDKFNVAIIPSKTGRASGGNGIINMSSKDSVRTVVHEIGHNIESKRGAEGRALRVAFFDERTSGDRLERLSSLLPEAGYGRREVTKKDQWVHPYTGSVYTDTDRNPASEIISMGLDTLYTEPHKLIRDDPGFFDFLIGYLQGE